MKERIKELRKALGLTQQEFADRLGIKRGSIGNYELVGLKLDAERLIMGIPAADTEGFIHYGENLTIPYVGVGFICRYMEDGVTSYVPYILS